MLQQLLRGLPLANVAQPLTRRINADDNGVSHVPSRAFSAWDRQQQTSLPIVAQAAATLLNLPACPVVGRAFDSEAQVHGPEPHDPQAGFELPDDGHLACGAADVNVTLSSW